MGGKTFFGVLLVAVGLIAAYAFATGKLSNIWAAITGEANPASTPTTAAAGTATTTPAAGTTTTTTAPQPAPVLQSGVPPSGSSLTPNPQPGSAPPPESTIENSGIPISTVSPSPYQTTLNPLVTTPAPVAGPTPAPTSTNGASMVPLNLDFLQTALSSNPDPTGPLDALYPPNVDDTSDLTDALADMPI